jgi:hypothetical protein
LSYSGIDEILVSRLKDKAILLIFQPLKMVLGSSRDGVPLKFKKKNTRASSSPA